MLKALEERSRSSQLELIPAFPAIRAGSWLSSSRVEKPAEADRLWGRKYVCLPAWLSSFSVVRGMLCGVEFGLLALRRRVRSAFGEV